MNDPAKLCEIAGCPHPILSRHRRDEGGHLCPVHFYALCVVESRGEPLDMQDGPKRRYFINAVTIISQAQRAELLAWRKSNPSPATSHESPVTEVPR